MEKKIVNTKYTINHINLIKEQAKRNKRTFHDELELILDEYFQNKADEQAFNAQERLMKKGEF